MDEGLTLLEPDLDDADGLDDEDAEAARDAAPPDLDAQSLRDEFVDAFNARDLDALLSVVAADVECPDRHAVGMTALAQEVTDIWHRAPGVILTRAFLDDAPCAVAWLPEDDGSWSRAALVCLDAGPGDARRPLISLVELPDDADAVDRAEADDPTGEELEEGIGWVQWEVGEEPPARARR